MKKIRCSSLPRIGECNGSMNAEDGLQGSDSAQSLAGNAGHGSLEGYYDELTWWIADPEMRERPTIDKFLEGLDDMTAGRARWYAKVMDEIIESHGGAVEIHTELKMRAVLENGFGQVELTGHADLCVVCVDGVTLVSDWKFNFLDVPEAAQNLQLRGYGYLVSVDSNLDILRDEIHTILIAGGNENPFTAAVYTPEVMKRAEAHLFSIIGKAVAEDARRTPSDHSCLYCKARGTSRCEESIEEIKQLPALTQPYEILPSKTQCVELFKAVKTVEAFGRKFQKDLKDAVNEDPESWAEFFEMSNTGSNRTILDAQVAYATFVEEEKLMTHDEFMSTMKVAIGKLEKACKPGLKEQAIKAKDQKKHVEGLLGSNLEKKEKAKSLKVVVKS